MYTGARKQLKQYHPYVYWARKQLKQSNPHEHWGKKTHETVETV